MTDEVKRDMQAYGALGLVQHIAGLNDDDLKDPRLIRRIRKHAQAICAMQQVTVEELIAAGEEVDANEPATTV